MIYTLISVVIEKMHKLLLLIMKRVNEQYTTKIFDEAWLGLGDIAI